MSGTTPRIRTLSTLPVTLLGVALIAVVLIACTSGTPVLSPPAAATVATPCESVNGPPSARPGPTTVATLEQAYRCILANYVTGPDLDDRRLLEATFTAITQESQRRGIDRPDAVMPALTGERDDDWTAFSAVYRKMTVGLTPQLQQAVASAAMRAMVGSLDDNHAKWQRTESAPGGSGGPGGSYGIGITGLSGAQNLRADPAATAPLFITSVAAGSPAARHGLRPGDVVIAVNDVTPFVNGRPVQGVIDWIRQPEQSDRPVRLRLNRPSTGRAWSVALKPARYPVARPEVSAKLLPGDLAYVGLTDFFPGVADHVLQAIDRLGRGRALRGIVLDLRGNGGGSPAEVTRLLGGFVHGAVTSYQCGGRGDCQAIHADDTVPLLNLPLVVLIDRVSASAADDFSAAVKGLRLGRLVGTRTAGVVAGPQRAYQLDDNTQLLLPATHHRGPNRELVDTIGVPADHIVPRTAHDFSTGRDPVLAKARDLLR